MLRDVTRPLAIVGVAVVGVLLLLALLNALGIITIWIVPE
jgi:hypothetical protein